MSRRRIAATATVALALVMGMPSTSPAQSAEVDAPFDLTGYWVALVTNEWRWRMLTPEPGDYALLPITPEASNVADGWDPQADAATGNACKSYGAPVIMQVPTRLNVTWESENLLRMETDAGSQVRLFHFGNSQPGEPDWQGHSVAEWRQPRAQAREIQTPGAESGTLRVVTTNLRPGYIRRNGVPYSDRTVVTEYFTPFGGPNGEDYFNVTVVVEDPVYLTEPFIRSMQFRREPDASNWNPTGCYAE